MPLLKDFVAHRLTFSLLNFADIVGFRKSDLFQRKSSVEIDLQVKLNKN